MWFSWIMDPPNVAPLKKLLTPLSSLKNNIDATRTLKLWKVYIGQYMIVYTIIAKWVIGYCNVRFWLV